MIGEAIMVQTAFKDFVYKLKNDKHFENLTMMFIPRGDCKDWETHVFPVCDWFM